MGVSAARAEGRYAGTRKEWDQDIKDTINKKKVKG